MNTKVNVHSFIYSLAIACYVFYSIFATSTLAVSYSGINFIYFILKGMVILCTVLKSLIIIKKVKNKFIYIIAIIIFGCIIFAVTDNYRMMYFVIFAFLAFNTDSKVIVKSTLIPLACSTSIVVVLAVTGVIENYEYVHEIMGINRTSYAMGFDYYSYLPMFILFGCIMYSYLKDSLRIRNYITMFILMYIVNYYCQKRLTFYVGIIFLAGHFLLINREGFDLSSKSKRNISVALPFLMFIMTVFLTFKYGGTDHIINRLFNGRLGFGKVAFIRYPIRLLGNAIQMYGGSASNYLSTSSYKYFYIDSGYIYCLLGYGVIFTIFLIAGLSALLRYACVSNQKALWWWLVIVLIYNVLGDTILTIAYNPILLLMISIIINNKRTRGRGDYYDEKQFCID